MSLSQDEAKVVAGYSLELYGQESQTTRKVIAALPAGQEGYTPDAKSMPALQLAWHIVSSEIFFLKGATEGKFTVGEPGVPDHIKSAADVLAWYDAEQPAVLAAAQALSGEALVREVDFYGFFSAPAYRYFAMMMHHAIHHRGQLSAYLRPMGAKVPGIYGPSGDEPLPGKE